MNLYELGSEYSKAFDELSDMELDADTINDSLALLRDDFETKAISCIKYEKGLNGQIEVLKAEIDRLTKMKKSIINKQEAFKEYIRTNMESTGINKISCDLFTITLRKSVKAVEIDEGVELDEKWLKPQPDKIDKAGIKKELSNGNPVFGAKLVDGKRALMIK